MITGTEDRQRANVALTRGTDTNTAYVFTLSPKIADPAPGPHPAPELARYDRLIAERGGEPSDAILHAIWTAETAAAREQRYRKLLMEALMLTARSFSTRRPSIPVSSARNNAL